MQDVVVIESDQPIAPPIKHSEYRITVIGAGGVGKSALTLKFMQGKWVEKYDPTIEDSYTKQVIVDGNSCLLDVMDTAGQEEFSALRSQYIATGQGFVLVYSITSEASMTKANELRNEIVRTREDKAFPIVLVGNKCDLEKQRVISTAEGEERARQWNAKFIEASAKNDINVEAVFYELVRRIDQWRVANPAKTRFKKRIKCTLF